MLSNPSKILEGLKDEFLKTIKDFKWTKPDSLSQETSSSVESLAFSQNDIFSWSSFAAGSEMKPSGVSWQPSTEVPLTQLQHEDAVPTP